MPEKENNPLINFVANLTGNQYLKVEEDLGQGFVRLNISEAERRQAKHDIQSMEDIVLETLRNSRDAGASKIFIASTKEDNLVRKVTIIDNGDGIPTELHDRVFEPRVTSKLENLITDRYGIHGRGMALFSIKQVSDEIDLVFSAPGRGSVFRVQTSTGLLSERKDQSTYPTIKYRNGEPIIIKGPHNIIRTVLEFNLDHQHLEIYLGSPTEILATAHKLCLVEKTGTDGAKAEDYKIWRCLKPIKAAGMLSDIAERRLGLKVSIRNAQRIMSERIVTLEPLLETLTAKQEEQDEPERKSIDLMKTEPLAKRISQADLEHIALKVSEELKTIGDKYFMELSPNPEVSADKDCIRVTIKLQSKGNY